MPTFQIRHGRVLQTVEYTTAFLRTMTPKWIYGPMRRDIVSAARLGNSYQPLVVLNGMQSGGQTSSNFPSLGAGVQSFSGSIVPVTPLNAAQTVATLEDVQCPLFAGCDDITHTGSRADPQLRMMIEFWDSETAPGVAQNHFGAPTSGEYDVVIAGNATLTVGQLVTSPTAFPVAAMVVAVKQGVQLVDSTGLTQRSGTSVTLSKKALSSTAELLTFTGSQLLAWHTPEGDIIGGGTFSTIR